jgi:hypothetical protein
MATRSSQSMSVNNLTDAAFRGWSKFIYDTMIDGGWVQTADTGQINFSTATRPTVANQKAGYVIMRMDDDLQTDHPVYMRMDFGNSSTVGSAALWVTLGPSSDGSGNIEDAWLTPVTTSAIRANSQPTYTSPTPLWSWGSADTARVAVALGFVTAGGVGLVFMLERAKNGAGQDTGDGLILFYSDAESNLNSSQFLFTDDVVQPPEENVTIPVILSSRSGSAVASEDWGVAIPFPFAGIVVQPGINVLVTRSTDQSIEGRFAGYVYGVRHTYQTLLNLGVRGTSLTRVLMRYE